MKISQDQNSNESISLLAAQRHLYSKAKTAHAFRYVGSLLWLALSPLLVYFLPEAKTSIAVVSCLIFLFSEFIFEPFERSCINTAAIIQEAFDVKLFEISWNQILAGSKPSPEVVDSESRSFGPKTEGLANWYEIPDELPKGLQILICQRANLVWDSRIRNYFGYVLYSWALIIFSIGLGVSYSLNLSLSDYLFVFLIPSLSPIVSSYRWGFRHFEVATEKRKLEAQFSHVWEAALVSEGKNIEANCRTIQDGIFLLRKKEVLVPDWFYKAFQPDFQKSMVAASNVLCQEAKAKMLPPAHTSNVHK